MPSDRRKSRQGGGHEKTLLHVASRLSKEHAWRTANVNSSTAHHNHTPQQMHAEKLDLSFSVLYAIMATRCRKPRRGGGDTPPYLSFKHQTHAKQQDGSVQLLVPREREGCSFILCFQGICCVSCAGGLGGHAADNGPPGAGAVQCRTDGRLRNRCTAGCTAGYCLLYFHVGADLTPSPASTGHIEAPNLMGQKMNTSQPVMVRHPPALGSLYRTEPCTVLRGLPRPAASNHSKKTLWQWGSTTEVS